MRPRRRRRGCPLAATGRPSLRLLRAREWPGALGDVRRWRDAETDPVFRRWLERVFRRLEHEEFRIR